MKVCIKSVLELINLPFESIPDDEYWNYSENKELKMHKIHIYPAKFPALIAQKAFQYATSEGIKLNVVGDVFCGCGTVALESKVHEIDFWGTDINPVAALISYAKTVNLNILEFEKRYKRIIYTYNLNKFECASFNSRLLYWHDTKTYHKLNNLLESIREVNVNGKYRKVFYMLFSSILKSTSKWLSSSIKPQIDPYKDIIDPIELFDYQIIRFVKAYNEISSLTPIKKNTTILNTNILRIRKKGFLDAIITSPPYVTSYEYADLHQLSSLWLEYAEKFTDLRKNSIGSLYHQNKYDYSKKMMGTAKYIVNQLDFDKRKKNMISRYYHDMKLVVDKCWNLLHDKGFVLFVIGNTEYKGVEILNAESLAEMIVQRGFTITEISKRKISSKFLPSHRDVNGKFTSDKQNSRKIYSQEYIIIGKKVG